jgi:hypothetical protein
MLLAVILAVNQSERKAKQCGQTGASSPHSEHPCVKLVQQTQSHVTMTCSPLIALQEDSHTVTDGFTA